MSIITNKISEKIAAIAANSSMGLHVMFDDGDFQITLRDNNFIKCSEIEPYHSGWFKNIEEAIDKVLMDMDAVMVAEFGDDCIRIFKKLVES